MNKKMRLALKTRARFLCEYCLSQEYFSPDPFEGDHIIATSQGGSVTLDNLALSCSGCNGYKSGAISAIDPGTVQRVPLYNPRKDVWSDHFRWHENFTLIIGISPTGRATVEKLKLNRASVVNLRTVLYKVGEHPK
jgi:5-methylcytosine-specific restriction endonuclease McrA